MPENTKAHLDRTKQIAYHPGDPVDISSGIQTVGDNETENIPPHKNEDNQQDKENSRDTKKSAEGQELISGDVNLILMAFVFGFAVFVAGIHYSKKVS